MIIKNVYQAKASLSSLINEALSGKEVFISKSNIPKVKLVPVNSHSTKRKAGVLKGKIKIKEDFDTLPDEIAAAFEMK